MSENKPEAKLRGEDMIWRNIRLCKIIFSMFIFIFCIISICSCGSEPMIVYEYDSGTYLTGDTPFENVACTFLPSGSELENTKVTYYEYIKHSEEESLRISVVYSDEEFKVAKQKIDDQYVHNPNQVDRDSFYFDGIFYNAYMFYVDAGRYVMAYHICANSNSISYVLSQNYQYEYLTIPQAFAMTYGEHRITLVP